MTMGNLGLAKLKSQNQSHCHIWMKQRLRILCSEATIASFSWRMELCTQQVCASHPFHCTNQLFVRLTDPWCYFPPLHKIKGFNRDGQLGRDDERKQFRCIPPQKFGNKRIIKVGCGSLHTVVLTENYQLFGMGYNEHNEMVDMNINEIGITKIMLPCPIRDFSCGTFQLVVQSVGGQYFFRGYNTNCQLNALLRDEDMASVKGNDPIRKFMPLRSFQHQTVQKLLLNSSCSLVVFSTLNITKHVIPLPYS